VIAALAGEALTLAEAYDAHLAGTLDDVMDGSPRRRTSSTSRRTSRLVARREGAGEEGREERRSIPRAAAPALSGLRAVPPHRTSIERK
jgi:hypothetical protein